MLRELSEEGPFALVIPDVFLHRFGRAPRDHAFWVLWSEGDERLSQAGPVPDSLRRPAPVPPPNAHPKKRAPPPFVSEQNGRVLQLTLASENGRRLTIGRTLAKEFDALWSLLARLLGMGTVALVASGIAAWWISRRIAAPITDLAATAHRLTEHELYQRLLVPQPTAEMTELAVAINAMLQRLQDAFGQQKRFVADVAHELRTPVSVILAQSEHLLARDRTADDYCEGLETSRKVSLHMKRLVENLLTLTRIDAGQLQLDYQSVDLAEITRGAIEMVCPLTNDKNLPIVFNEQSAPLLGDRLRLQQVALNLLSNAIAFSKPGDEIRVSVGCAGDEVFLEVTDSGIGIDEDALPRVWERFYRVDQARTLQDGSGTGLGLSLVGEFVRLHGGRVKLRSRPLEGTTVRVVIPRTKTEGVSTEHRTSDLGPESDPADSSS
jgi:heavy metal sensor kinase